MNADNTQSLQELKEEYKRNPRRILFQLRMCKYKDEHGHPLEMNVAFKAIEDMIEDMIKIDELVAEKKSGKIYERMCDDKHGSCDV